MLRALLIASPLLLLPISLPAAGPLDAAAAAQSGGQNCERRNEGRRQAGRAIGSIGRGILGRVGGAGGAIANNLLPMASLLDNAIMSLLDCDEQNKAASATEEVVERAERGGVGTTSTWESDSRPGVTGRSTVTAVDNSGGQQCMTVTDVVIVDGEETTAPKQMCRRPPSNRYVRV